MELVAVLVLGLLLGSVLGYWAVLLRVWRLEKELTQALLRQSELEMALDSVMEKKYPLGKDWA
jgi:predicted lysophospholipase L1 biosynthesis ABC-type transport system permease subunit